MSARFPDLPPALANTLAGTRDAGAARVRPICPFGPGDGAAVQLLPGRVHEATGSARATFAVVLAGALTGGQGKGPGDGQAPDPVIWIRPSWAPDRLHPDGMRPFADPGRFLFVDVPRDADLLWCMEEALRSGQPALVVADLPAIPGLTAVRRLTLAAEAGTKPGSGGRRPTTGLILTPGAGGAPGVETRWRMDTDHGAGPAWRIERLRARMAPPAAFRVVPDRDGRLVLAPGQAPVQGPAQDGGFCPPGGRGARPPPEIFGQG